MKIKTMLTAALALVVSTACSGAKQENQSLVAFDTQDGEATVLAGLCHAEEDGPKDALRCCTDGQKHLGK